MPDIYTCTTCGQPIINEIPHTTTTGEDAHETCCDVCHPPNNTTSTNEPWAGPR